MSNSQPEEIKERMAQQQAQNQVEAMGIVQITGMLEKSCKLFGKSKKDAKIPEEIYIQWIIAGVINTLADLCAYSASKGYVQSLEELIIASAETTHAVAQTIIDHHTKGGEEKKIILPGEEA